MLLVVVSSVLLAAQVAPAFLTHGGAQRQRGPHAPRRLRGLRTARRFAGDREDREDTQAADVTDVGGWLLSIIGSFFAFLSGLLGSVLAFFRGLREEESPSPQSGPRIVQQLGAAPVDAQTNAPVYSLGPFPACTEASNLRLPGRHFTIVTTGALPWRTGPAVNALLRALTLAKRGYEVVLVLPWLDEEGQAQLFPGQQTFATSRDQEQYIRKWCVERAHINPAKLPLELRWYEASYMTAVRSVFPCGDVSELLDGVRHDVLIMEEPEHLCWYHNGRRWPTLYRHVVGVVHTNYRVYLAGMGYEGLMSSATVRDSILLTFTSMVCSAYCDVTIKLSPAGVSLPNDVISNIHGVRDEFLQIGRGGFGQWVRERIGEPGSGAGAPRAYFIGKAVYPKGWGELLRFLKEADGRLADVRIDAFGTGPDWDAIWDQASRMRQERRAELHVFPEVDHADPAIRACQVLVNPSTAEILCTVTAEALAMRKRVVLPRHASNHFFAQHFPERCFLYDAGDAAGFEAALRAALAAGQLPPLSEEQQRLLSWDAAVDRLCEAAEVHVLSGSCSRPSEVRGAKLAYEVHQGIQTEVPSLSKLLKDATLKSHSPMEEYLARVQEGFLADWAPALAGLGGGGGGQAGTDGERQRAPKELVRPDGG